MLDTSEAEVSAAIKNMEESGVIVKYTAIVNGEALSEEIVQALIEVRVTPQKVNGFDAIAEEIYRFDEVQSLYLMSGGYDLAVFIEEDLCATCRVSLPNACPPSTVSYPRRRISSSKNTRSRARSRTDRTTP